MMGKLLWLCAQLWRAVRTGAAWRWVAVLGAGLFGLATTAFANAHQLALVLKFVVLVIVSLVCGSWALIAATEIALALLWWLAVRRRRASLPARLVVEANRLLGHVEALSPLLVLSLVAPGPAWLRFGAVAWLIAWGPRTLTWLTVQWHWRRRHLYPSDAWVRSARRLPMYGVTLLGGGGLFALAPGQGRAMLPVAVAVLAAMSLRVAVTFRRDHRRSGLTDRQWSRVSDVVTTLAVLAAIAASAWMLTRLPSFADTRHRISQPACTAAPEGPPLIATWLLADSQFHELRGSRPVANMPMVDAVVPVAVRPVVLDLLSGVTLDHFARLYRRYAERHPATQLSYAYLGDLADIGCRSEIARFDSYWRRFEPSDWRGGPGSLAGIASGNHDNTYVGNFAWHPEWTTACQLPGDPSDAGVADKPAADALIRGFARSYGVAGLWLPEAPLQCLAGVIEHKASLPMVSPLGVLPGDAAGPARPVVAVFLDSGDSAFWQFGASGSMGNVSALQIAAAEAQVPANAWVVLMIHHPLDQLGMFSRWRLGRLIGRWRAGPLGDRLLLVVSGHTHRSAFARVSQVGDQTCREFTVGSTTDPTQEAAVLELRGSASRPQVTVATVPAVHRPAMDCGALSDIGAETCRAALAPMLGGPDRGACLATDEFDYGDAVDTTAEMTLRQQRVAAELRGCLGVDHPGSPLDPEVYTQLARQAEGGAQRVAMVCLSWASALLQGHKLQGWRYADALRCQHERAASLGGLSVTWRHGDPLAAEPGEPTATRRLQRGASERP